MDDVVIVTGSDEAFYPYARACLKRLKPIARLIGARLVFLDGGLAPNSRTEVAEVARIVNPPWPLGLKTDDQAIQKRRLQLVRPFLDELLPGASTIVWVDADAYVLNPHAFLGFIGDAVGERACAVREYHPMSVFSGAVAKASVASLERVYALATDPKRAFELAVRPNVNAGVLAIGGSSRLWGAWRTSIAAMLSTHLGRKPPIEETRLLFTLVDQLALNVALDDFALNAVMHFYDLTYNWPCHLILPRVDFPGVLLDPGPARSRINVLHFTNHWGDTIARAQKNSGQGYLRRGDRGKEDYRQAMVLDESGLHRSCDLMRLVGL